MTAKHSHGYIHESLKGMYKKDNEDNYLAIESNLYNIYAIFDGVGSALNSKKATSLAKDFIKTHHDSYFNGHVQLDRLMYDCNNYIIDNQMPELFTTYCIIVIFNNEPDEAVYSNMGDSRIYLISKQFIEQITTDDRMQFANVVTKCLGMNTLGNYDFHQNSINITDKNLLLCTDGFYHFLEDNRMKFFEIFNKKNLDSIKEQAMSIIIDRNKDDATFLFIR